MPTRERKNPPYFEAPLHTLLVEKIPQMVYGGRINCSRLAAEMGRPGGHSGVRAMFGRKHIGGRVARELLAVARRIAEREGVPVALTPEDLLPFILGE